MRRWLRRPGLLLGCLGLLALAAGAQPSPPLPPALAYPVQLRPGRRPLGAVLTELARQGRLPLSYSSSLVPLGHRTQVRPGPPRPLAEVLAAVLAAEHLRFGLLDGQLVLWPDRVAPPPGLAWVSGRAGSGPPVLSPGELVSAMAQRAGRPAAGQPANRAADRPVGAAGHSPAHAGAPGPAHPAAGSALVGQTGQGHRPAGRLNRAIATRQRGSQGRVIQSPSYPGPAQPSPVAAGHPGRAGLAGPARTPARATAPPKPVAGRSNSPNPVAVGGRSASGSASSPASRVRQLPTAGRPVERLPGRVATPLPVATPVLPAAVAGTGLPARRQPDNALPVPLPRLRGLYLHAEAWGSESLPVGATVKVGIPRAYLLLNAALAAKGRPSGPAFGLGLGTAGRVRGRFTPNLDVLAWRVGGGRGQDEEAVLLTQLRPQLSWQVRRGGRLALVAGPTLNLATAHHRGPQTSRWDFGRDQWLWVNQVDDESLLRLWPGVQVGIRF